MKPQDEREIVARIHQARWSAFKIFKPKWDQMQENSNFIRLKQYSVKQLQKMEAQKRVPYVLDYINSAINTFQGIQRDKRTEIAYYAQEPGDDVKVEILNAVKEATLQQNNFVYIESDVFQDGLIEKLGCTSYEWSREKNKNGALKIMRVPPRQMMWDLNSREHSKEDATWVSRTRLYGKRDLINRYPERKKLIQKMDIMNSDFITSLGLDATYITDLIADELGAAALVEFYEKKYESRYFIVEKTSGYVEPIYYDDQKAADSALREKKQKAEGLAAQASNAGQPSPELDLDTFRDNFPVVLKSEVGLQAIVFNQETIDEPFYPFDFYHPYYYDGDWWGPVDVLKDGQRFFNKMFSMADHWINSMSKGLLMGGHGATAEERKRVKEVFATTGGFVNVKDPENYKLFESRGPAPQLFTMLELARQNLEDNAGGRNFMGKKETASESGVAVRTRIEQGGLSGFVVYDNLRRWKIGVGEKMAWYLTTYMTQPQAVRIEGEQLVQETLAQLQVSGGMDWFDQSKTRPGIGFLKVNTDKQNTIENLKADVIVDEARWSISKNQSILQEINMALQSNPALAQVFPPETMLEFMNLPFSVKEEAKKSMAQREQQQQQLEQAKISQPPSLSAALGDIDKLPPIGQAQLASQFHIQLDPSQIQDPKQAEQLTKLAGIMTDHAAKREAHNQSLKQQAEKHILDIQTTAEKTKQKMLLDHAQALHKMELERMKADTGMKVPAITIQMPQPKKRKLKVQRDSSGHIATVEDTNEPQ